MQYEVIIGLEIHIQLTTRSKLFSPSSAAFGARQNTHIHEIDLGYPGVLPVLNRQAVFDAALFGLAIGAHINREAVFMRKNYFYPDLPKGYQISQLEEAIVQGGAVSVQSDDGSERRVRINRAQLEEDAGKSVHDAFSDATGIDLNRAGVPLIELVSEPDMRSIGEAIAYMRKIHSLVRYLGISDGNMEEGSFRCDVNVSLRPFGESALRNRVELKNLNSFRFVEQALEYEIERQSDLLDAGKQVEQETRLYDPDQRETRTMRSKEEANDYRYFPDPDLLPLALDEAFMEEVRAALPELPEARKARMLAAGLSEDDALYLIQTRQLGDYFDATVKAGAAPKAAANWIQGQLAATLNQHALEIDASRVSPAALAGLIAQIEQGAISSKIAKKVFDDMWESGESAETIIEQSGLRQVSDSGQIEAWVNEALEAFPEQFQALKNGQSKLMGFFVGQIMKRSQGQANPQMINQVMQKKLKQDQ